MKKNKLWAIVILSATIFTLAPRNVSGAELVTNGGFETGDFTGWTVTNGTIPWITWRVTTAGNGGGFVPLPLPTSPPEGLRDAWQGVAGSAGSTFTLSQLISVPAGQTASLSWKHRFQQNLTTFCTISSCGTNFYRVEILNTSNVVIQTLYTVTAFPLTDTDTGWQTHYFSLNAYAGQTIRVRFSTVVSAYYDGPGQLEVDAVSAQSPATPTAANVSVGGRIQTSAGTGIRNVAVSLTDSQGNTRITTSSTLGYYRFEQVPVGETVVVSVIARKYNFNQPVRTLNVHEVIGDLNFIADDY